MRSLADGQSLAVRPFGLPQGRLEVRSDLIRNNQKKNWTDRSPQFEGVSNFRCSGIFALGLLSN